LLTKTVNKTLLIFENNKQNPLFCLQLLFWIFIHLLLLFCINIHFCAYKFHRFSHEKSLFFSTKIPFFFPTKILFFFPTKIPFFFQKTVPSKYSFHQIIPLSHLKKSVRSVGDPLN